MLSRNRKSESVELQAQISMSQIQIPFPALILAAGCMAVSFLMLEPPIAAISCVLGWTLLAIAVIDFREFIIPDLVSLPSIPAGLLASAASKNETANVILEHAFAAALGATLLYVTRRLYSAWRKREGLGLGDVKLAAVAGAWTGIPGLGHVLLLACILAILYVLFIHLHDLRSIRGSTAIAFGVFLAPSIWIVWCVSNLGFDFSVAI